MLSAGPVAKLLERDGELAQIDGALRGASHGEGGALLLRGDAGIGKTALLGAAVAAARVEGFAVLEARADSLETELSFGVCSQLFGGLDPAREGVDGSALFSGAAAFARPALVDGELFPAIPGEDRTLPLINGLYWLCANLAEQGPLLVCVDDAHWSDLPSLRFLNFLTRRLSGLPVALVVAQRPGGAGSDASELLAALAGEPGLTVLHPSRLDVPAATQLIGGELGEPDAEFVRACMRLTGGNPLYLGELVRGARGRGLRPSGDQTEALGVLRPERITESVLARVAALGEGRAA